MKTVLDGEPSPEEREAAESEYRVAVEEWQQLVSGPSDTDGDDAATGEPRDDESTADAESPAETEPPAEGSDPLSEADPEASASS